MRNIKIIIEYDGKNFAGWQIQPGKTSIQGEMQRALKEVCIRFNELMDYMNSFIQEIEKQI